MKKYLLFICISVFMFYNFGFAQDNDLGLEVSEAIREQCEHKVKAMSDHFAIIATKEEKDEIKDYHIDACLDLFIGKGNDVKDENGNVIYNAPRIDAFSPSKGAKSTYFINRYLYRLKSVPLDYEVDYVCGPNFLFGEIKQHGKNEYRIGMSYTVTIASKTNSARKFEVMGTIKILVLRKVNKGQSQFDVELGDITIDQIQELH